MPRRPSRLFALPPQGIGGREVESLTSYARRLAYEHVVSVTTLLRTVVLVDRADHLSVEPPNLAEGINGAADLTGHVVSRLSGLTGIGGLRRLTMLDLDSVYVRRSFRRFRAWCPLCLANDRIPYDRLGWSVAGVETCIVHGANLIDACPRCGESHMPWHSRSTPTECPFCGGRLGDAAASATGGIAPAAVVAQLIHRIQQGAVPTLASIRGGVSATIARFHGARNLARRVGVTDATLYRLEFSDRPSLSTLVGIVAASGGTLDEFLAHPPKNHRRLGQWNPHPTSARIDVRAALETAEGELRKPVSERLSATAVARRSSVDITLLRTRGGSTIRRLIGERKVFRAEAARNREPLLQAEVRRAVADLRRAGYAASSARVEAQIGRRGARLSPEWRSAWRVASRGDVRR